MVAPCGDICPQRFRHPEPGRHGGPCLLLGVLASDVSGTYLFALLYFAVAVPVPVMYVVWLVKSGRVDDFHLPERRDRTGPFAVSIAGAVGAAALLYYFGAPVVFLAPVLTALVQTVLLFLITLRWQISIHTATAAGLVTFAILALGSGAAILAVLVPLVAWARVFLGRHTVAQTVREHFSAALALRRSLPCADCLVNPGNVSRAEWSDG